MLLAIDIGNTNTVLGVFDGEKLDRSWRIKTDSRSTADELALTYRGLLADHPVDGIAACSTVPAAMRELRQMLADYYGNLPTVLVEPGVRTGVSLQYENPKEVGADRIVNTLAAYHLVHGPAIVVDFGTTTNFDVVNERGDFMGGALAPGIEVSLDALAERAADVRVLQQPGASTGRARNAALGSLAGDVVVLVGDDVTPAEDWLDALLLPLADPSVHAVTGNILPARPDDLDAQLLDDRGALGGGPHSLRYGPEWLTRSRGPARTWCIGSTDNAAVRRDVLAALGGFDETMGAAGDADLFYRILRAGGQLHYEATAVALRRPTGGRSLRDAVSDSSAEHVRYHLEVLTRYRDPRGLARLAVGLPRQYLRRASWLLRIRDDYPGDLLAAEVGGYVAGFSRWLRRRGRAS